MFGETTISYVKNWNHPVETTTNKWMFGVPGFCVSRNTGDFSLTPLNGVDHQPGCIQIVWGHDVIHSPSDRKIDFESPCTDSPWVHGLILVEEFFCDLELRPNKAKGF